MTYTNHHARIHRVPFLYIQDRGRFTSTEQILLCPLCGDSNTHIDNAYVAGRVRGEDSEVIQARLDSAAQLTYESVPIESSRRHAFGLSGYCEACGDSFLIGFSQHKGETFVSIQKATP